jgi:hypothetical protein
MTDPVPDMDRSDVMLAAVRYSMGRMTMMPRTVQRYILAHMHEWPQLERDRLAIAIEQEAEVAGRLGDDIIDRPGWIALRNALRRVE